MSQDSPDPRPPQAPRPPDSRQAPQPAPADAAQPPSLLESLIEFPADFPIKIMGRSADGFTAAVVAIVREHAPDFDPQTLEVRPSSQGNYLALTATIRATSRAQLDALYQALTAHPMVKVVL